MQSFSKSNRGGQQLDPDAVDADLAFEDVMTQSTTAGEHHRDVPNDRNDYYSHAPTTINRKPPPNSDTAAMVPITMMPASNNKGNNLDALQIHRPLAYAKLRELVQKEGLDDDEIAHYIERAKKMKNDKDTGNLEIDYTHFPAAVQEVMRHWDTDGSGTIGVQELSAAAKAEKKMEDEERFLKKALWGTFFLLILLIGSNFAVTTWALALAKDTFVDNPGNEMQTSAGESIRVKSGDLEVDANGNLMPLGSAEVVKAATAAAERRLDRLREANGVY